MKKTTLVALAFTAWGGIAHATAISTTGTYTASSVATIEPSMTDAQFGSSPPASLPLATSATSSDGTNSAFGTGIGDSGFLAASSEIAGADATVFAFGYSEYMGTFFAPDGAFQLRIDFNNAGQASGADAMTETVLGLNLTSGLTTLWSFEYHYPLLNDATLLDQTLEQMFTLPVGTLADLNVWVSSTANATTPGEAFNLASAQFTLASVPEPSTLLALIAGLALLPLARRRSREIALTRV